MTDVAVDDRSPEGVVRAMFAAASERRWDDVARRPSSPPPMKSTKLRAPLFVALLATAATLACADMKALYSLVNALQGEYHVPVNANLNGSHLVLLFARFPQAKLSPDERAAFARDIARFARAHYAGAARLTDIGVGTVQRSGAGPVTFTRTEVPYRFTIAELDDSSGDAPTAADVPLVGPAAVATTNAAAAAAAAAPDPAAALPHRLAACPGFVAARAGGVDSVGIDPLYTVGSESLAPVRYPPSLGGSPHAPTGRVELEYVLGANGVPDMRTALVVSSTGDPFTLAACDALRRSREAAAASFRDGHAVRALRRRTFVIAPAP
jgi:hypothetical protein